VGRQVNVFGAVTVSYQSGLEPGGVDYWQSTGGVAADAGRMFWYIADPYTVGANLEVQHVAMRKDSQDNRYITFEVHNNNSDPNSIPTDYEVRIVWTDMF
jgi:hypothetical protein